MNSLLKLICLGCTGVALQAEPLPLQPKNFTTGAFVTKEVQGRSVWEPTNPQGVLHFDVPADWSVPSNQPAYVEIEYVDSDPGRLLVEYDSTLGSQPADIYADSESHTRSSRVGTETFVKSYHSFESPRLTNRQAGQTDFRMRLLNPVGQPLQVASVSISATPYADEQFARARSRPWLEPYIGPVEDWVDNQTLSGKVMAGYQGWFNAPNDIFDTGWKHWGRSRDAELSPTEITVDMWPFMENYRPENVYRAGSLELGDGRPAYLFSSGDLDTVRTHFRWMRQYNIDGVYLQRFVTRNNSGYYGAKEFVLHNVRQAAREEGRVWALEYDVSSLDTDPNPLEVMQNDWNWLVNQAGILDDPRYLHENGKPVLFIWGFSVSGRDFTVAQANEILDWFRTHNLYLIGGVSSTWENKTDWYSHYRKYDQLLAWQEDSLSELNQEKQLLESWGMRLLPHVWPGFSWANLKQLQPGEQYTARTRGQFYWTRIATALDSGADQLFLGMFDEYDEATAIMPMSDNHPAPHTAWGNYITNAGRDPFWWLALSGAAKEALNGLRDYTSTIPAEADVSPPAHMGPAVHVYPGNPNRSEGITVVDDDDGQTLVTVLGGQTCRVNVPNPNLATYIYFNVQDDFFQGTQGQYDVMIEAEVFAVDPGTSVRLHYDGADKVYTLATMPASLPKQGAWVTMRWWIQDGNFQNRLNNGADLRLVINNGKQAGVRRLSAFLPDHYSIQSNTLSPNALTLSSSSLYWSEQIDAVGWKLYRSPDLSPQSWIPIPDSSISFQNGRVEHDFRHYQSPQFFLLKNIH